MKKLFLTSFFLAVSLIVWNIFMPVTYDAIMIVLITIAGTSGSLLAAFNFTDWASDKLNEAFAKRHHKSG
jgi:hypothetical protein